MTAQGVSSLIPFLDRFLLRLRGMNEWAAAAPPPDPKDMTCGALGLEPQRARRRCRLERRPRSNVLTETRSSFRSLLQGGKGGHVPPDWGLGELLSSAGGQGAAAGPARPPGAYPEARGWRGRWPEGGRRPSGGLWWASCRACLCAASGRERAATGEGASEGTVRTEAAEGSGQERRFAALVTAKCAEVASTG